jgi:hypothetical protein
LGDGLRQDAGASGDHGIGRQDKAGAVDGGEFCQRQAGGVQAGGFAAASGFVDTGCDDFVGFDADLPEESEAAGTGGG